jgi:hypothetical protein
MEKFKEYYMKCKSYNNETFAKCTAYSLEEAIEYFSRLKVLPKKDLLEIYIVTDQV